MREELEFVTYCGIYCELCAERARIPQQAAALREAMTAEGWPYWGPATPDFAEFWRFLEGLARGGCRGCRAGSGYPECQIRICARERGFDLCADCPDFACDHLQALATRYPMLLADNRRLQAVGRARWLAEQQERARRGVVLADARYDVAAARED